jgi:hypothetical protein
VTFSASEEATNGYENATAKSNMFTCNYCGEPTTANKRTTADHKIYCGRLCAALGLIQDTDDEDGIDQDTGVEALTTLVEQSFLDGPVRVPKKVRECDIGAALRSLPGQVVMVVIDDGGTPDWVPELTSAIAQGAVPNGEGDEGPSQAEIDRVVEDLLWNGSEAEDLR